MKLLIVKTSSMGDVIHTFPAITDAVECFKQRNESLEIDWVVEEAFVDIATLHPAVNNVIPIALRRWKKAWLKSIASGEMGQYLKQLRHQHYDIVIDAQGLVKSAISTRLAKGKRIGYDKHSIKEPLASRAYQQRLSISRKQHAIARIRQLFANSLGYTTTSPIINYGLSEYTNDSQGSPTLILFHSTTWSSKHWPEAYWAELIQLAQQEDYAVKLPWSTSAEKARAERIVKKAGYGQLFPKLTLKQLAEEIAQSQMMVGTDTGLSHLAAAFNIPGVVIYGSTSAVLTGVTGPFQESLAMEYDCAPCLSRECKLTSDQEKIPCYYTRSPSEVWNKVKHLHAKKTPVAEFS